VSSPRCIAGLVIAALLLPAGLARADSAVIAVLPLSAGGRLAIYSKPVSDAMAKRLAVAAAVETESLSLSGNVPTRVDLLIDGRIVDVGKGKVKIECRVRDPGRGTTVVPSLATRARPLGDIDKLADEMAAALAPALVAALAAQKRLRAAENDPSRPVVAKPAAGDDDRVYRDRREPRDIVRDKRAPMLVFAANAESGGSDLPVAGIVNRAANWLTECLGFRPVSNAKPASTAALVAALTAAQADYGLIVDVRSIGFRWHGAVLSARARVRFALVDARGEAVFEGTVRTGTLVGSRGDRRAALVHHAAVQAVDIVLPHLKRVLAK
jgi:hypothetical protein